MRGKKILIVDNDEAQLKETREALHNDKLEVVTHRFGFGVVALASELQPDLVLIEINIPALSGDKLVSLLRTNDDTRHLQIVFYSSDDEDSLREIARTCDVQGYICKIDILNLKYKVNHYLSAIA
jgi:PleD family two-component response regulator